MEENFGDGFIEGIDNYFSQKLLSKNIKAPTAIQKIVIPRILNKESVLFRSQTGTGKTFAYLLPVLQNIINGGPPVTNSVLIVSPTLELCSQIKNEIDFLLGGIDDDAGRVYKGLKSILVTGSGSITRQADGIRKLKPAIIVGNSKRLLQLSDLKKLRLNQVKYIILDEVDRLIADELIEETKDLLSRADKSAIKIACSATLSPKNKSRIESILGTMTICESDEQEILRGSIQHLALWCEERDKINTLRSFLSAALPKKALVFAERSEAINNIVAKLNHHKYNAAGLYSGMEKKERKAALDAFRSGKAAVLVSTDVAARGLDIENITHIVTVGVNPDSEVYIHRAGRTARAGKKGVMVSIGDERELRYLQTIEKKLGIAVYPKVLYKGQIFSADEVE